MSSKIYKITNLINGKIYIGYTKKSLEERLKQHSKYKTDAHRNMPIVIAIKKYGIENFKIELIEESQDDDYIHYEREVFWIKELKSQNPKIGYNIANGGDGGDTLSHHPDLDNIKNIMKKASKHRKGWHHSEEVKKQLSKRFKGVIRYIPNEQQKLKMSERMRGENNPNFGKKMSEERKEFMHEVNSNNYYWNNGIKNRRAKECPGEGWIRGMLVTEESKKLRSKVHKGQPSAFKGKKHTEEAKEKLSKSHKGLFNGEKNPAAKTVEVISPSGERFIIKGTMKKFCEEHNISFIIYRRYKNKGPYKVSKYIAKDNQLAKNTDGWTFNSLD